jgi:SNF2 family DNA or RNA helicase
VLIKVNEELKAKIESVLKIKQTNSPLEYYKEQCEKIEGENDSLKQKMKALGLENKQFKI